MIITRGYGLATGGGTLPCTKVILVDGMTVYVDNEMNNINIDRDDYTAFIYGDGITLLRDSDDLAVLFDNGDITSTVSDDSITVSLECGSTIIPKEELMQKITGENVGGFRVVTTDSEGHIIHATIARILAGKAVIGVTMFATPTSTVCDIGVTGDEIIEASWNWDVNESIYLGVNGAMTQVIPTENFVQIVAVPLSPTSIRIRTEPPIFL